MQLVQGKATRRVKPESRALQTHVAQTDSFRNQHSPTAMTFSDRKWLQGMLAVLMKESSSVVTVVLDLRDGFGESVTMAILAATDSMAADVRSDGSGTLLTGLQGVSADLSLRPASPVQEPTRTPR